MIIPALAGCLLAGPRSDADPVLDALGTDPAGFREAWRASRLWEMRHPATGAPDAEPDPFPLAVLPVTPAARQQLLDSLLAPPRDLTASQHLALALLLEAWGRTGDALAWLTAPDAPATDPLHLVRLHYRMGNLPAAAAAFAAAQDPGRPEDARHSGPRRRFAALARPFIALARHEELAGFLAWLQPRCCTAAARAEVLALRLNVAWHTATVPQVLERLRSESPLLRQAADWLLTLDPATLPPDPAGLPPSDLILLHRVAWEAPAVRAALRDLVAGGRGSPAERLDLLTSLLDTPDPDRTLLLEKWLAHDESALAALDAALGRLTASGSHGLPTAPLAALADRHPEHHSVNLLAGLALRRDQPATGRPGEHAPSNTYLRRALRAPLLAEPGGEFSFWSSFIAEHPPDLPGLALAAMAETAAPPDLLETLTGHPEFAGLPPRARARYLAVARLDVPFVEALLALDWSDPSNDRCGDWLARYLSASGARRPPQDALWQQVATTLPAMLAGSPHKDPARIECDARTVRLALVRINPGDKTFEAVTPALAARLADRPGGLAERVAGMLREPTVLPPPPRAGQPNMQPDPLHCLAWFAPAHLMRWVDGPLPWEFLHRAQIQPSARQPGVPMEAMGVRFPVLTYQHFRYPPLPPQGLEAVWKLRRLLPADSPHAIACDLGIAHGQLPGAPEDLATTASQHVAKLLDQPQELDFILLKLQVARHRAQPADWTPLAALVTAPAATRRQASRLLGAAAAAMPPFPQVASLQQKLLNGIIAAQDLTGSAGAAAAAEAAYDQLQQFLRAGRHATPEATAFARKVLRDFLARGGRETSPTENCAITCLVKAGEFERFLAEVAADCRARPDGELACAKAMHALHQYKIAHSRGESLRFAKQVLALDPDDLPAAIECAAAATTDDLPGLLASLPALRRHHLGAFLGFLAREDFLADLPADPAPRLLEILALPDLGPPDPHRHAGWRLDNPPQQLRLLHHYFQQSDPQHGTRFRQLLLATEQIAREVAVPPLVDDLMEFGRRAEAAELLITLLALPATTPAPAKPLRFPTTPDRPFQWSGALLAVATAAIRHQLAPELLERLATPPAADLPADLLALLRYAASPNAESFTTGILPLLEPLNPSDRSLATQQLTTLLKPVPGAAERLELLDGADPRPPGPTGLAERIARCRTSGELPKLRGLWQQFHQLAGPENLRNEHLLVPMLPAMALAADDPLWADYAPCLLDSVPPTKNLLNLTRLLPPLARPALQPRLAPVLCAAARSVAAGGNNRESDARIIAHSAWLMDDAATLRFLAGELGRLTGNQAPPGLRKLVPELRLLAGDPAAALPVVWARPGPGEQWTILWSMTGVDAGSDHARNCLGADPALLDGAFDLALLAAPDAIRFRQVATVPGAKGGGSMVVTLPAETTTLGLTATHAPTMTVLHAPPLALASAKPPPFAVQPPAAPDRAGLRPLPSPFGAAEPVISLAPPPGGSVDLARLPWQPGQSLSVSAWLLTSGNARLAVQPRDEHGKPIEPPAVGSGSTDSPPRWHRFWFELSGQTETSADHFVLTATAGARPDDVARGEPAPALWLTDLRVACPLDTPPPAAAREVGRIPGRITAMGCDPAGEQLVAGTVDGRVIMLDTTSARRTAWQPCPGIAIDFVGIGGRRAVAMDSANTIHAIDLDAGAPRILGRIQRPGPADSWFTPDITPDGEWLAWTGTMTDITLARLGPERLGEPLVLPVGRAPKFAIDRTGNTLLASGDRHHFRIPLADLPALDPAKLEPLTHEPQPTSATRRITAGGDSWLDPLHALRIHSESYYPREPSFDARERALRIRAAHDALTVSPQGIVFYASPHGLVYQLDPTRVDGYLAPPTIPEQP